MKKNPEVSVLIVNYKSGKSLIGCINSIEKSKAKTSYEIIVVDNDEKNSFLEMKLKKYHKNIIYIKSFENVQKPKSCNDSVGTNCLFKGQNKGLCK